MKVEAVDGLLATTDSNPTAPPRDGAESPSLASLHERFMRDPSGAYQASDPQTRGRWVADLEIIAAASGTDSLTAVQELLRLAQTAEPAQHRSASYWLSGAGRSRLEEQLGARSGFVRRLALRRPAAAYVAATLSGAICLGLAATAASAASGATGVAGLMALLLLPGGALLSSALTQRLLCRFHPPRRPAAIPLDQLTTEIQVIVPVLVTSPRDVAAWADTVRANRKANPDANATYWLLSDFGAATSEIAQTDALLSETIREAIQASHSSGARVRWRHQARRWKAPADWRPWERKRGKIVEWFEAESDQDGEAFSVIIVLDVDAVVRDDGLRKLAAIAAHPSSGQGGPSLFLQPDVRPLEERETRFAAWFYPPSPSDAEIVQPAFWQDVLGIGMFYGKGRVPHDGALLAAGAISDDTVLSHDHLEGLLAGAMSINSVVLREAVPSDWPSWMARQHRWIRGDFQLLPWIIRGYDARAPHPRRLSPLARWRLAENLVMHISPVATTAAIVSFLCLIEGAPGVILALVAGLLHFPGDLAGLVDALWPRGGAQTSEVLRGERRRWTHRWKSALLEVLMLPYIATNAIDAAVRALWRMLMTRRNLLEWRTSAEVSRGSRSAAAHVLSLWPGALVSLSLAALVGVLGSRWAGATLAGAWLCGPVLAAFLASRSIEDAEPR